jgi:hypothetical protein
MKTVGITFQIAPARMHVDAFVDIESDGKAIWHELDRGYELTPETIVLVARNTYELALGESLLPRTNLDVIDYLEAAI